MKELLRIGGLVAAPFAPMDAEGNIDLNIVPDYYGFLVRNGVKGVFINGTTGEGASLTQSEKKAVVEAWTTFGKTQNSMNIITLVGGTSYQECIENAVHAQRSGVSAIAVIAPYFFKPPDVDQLAGFFIKIGETVPELPVFFYHMPSTTGVNFPMAGFINKVDKELPNFAGIKFTHEDFMDFLTCLNFGKRKYNILWGRDECMLSALTLGTAGFVGSTYNYAAPLYLKLIEAFRQNDLDEAQKLQQKSINMISILGKYGGIATGKAFMRYVGIDCGEFRSPVKNMLAEKYLEFEKDVRSLGMDDLFSK